MTPRYFSRSSMRAFCSSFGVIGALLASPVPPCNCTSSTSSCCCAICCSNAATSACSFNSAMVTRPTLQLHQQHVQLLLRNLLLERRHVCLLLQFGDGVAGGGLGAGRGGVCV